ncbi:ABC transporter permease [Alkalicoccus halolimnae]|uniref:ABC transporter permease n=1 Tax=Alkalicoccus halolimnae TaxID=1667239 RepID=A0A5C7F705_9BACI|nr:ABC transporter permease [Alkalicoccus halolimnae]TXF85188.1 ABC transporter permease [Alkalicoccus halolimnae]
MNNFWTTFSHTALRRIKSKAFAISTLIMALLIIGFFAVQPLMNIFGVPEGQEEQVEMTVADQSEFEGELGTALENGNFPGITFIDETGRDIEGLTLEAEESDSYLIVLQGERANLEAEFYGEASGFEVINNAQQYIEQTKQNTAASETNLSEEEKEAILSPVVISEQTFADGEEPEEVFSDSYWMVYGLVFVIYLIIITFGSMIATEVATEKSSRVMELIVSSISPVTQMFGKLAGIGAAGAVNIAVLAGAVAIGSLLNGQEVFQFIFVEVIEVSLIAYALLFIVLGYFVYGGIAAMLGALVSRAEEVNQAIQPLIFLAMIAFFLSIVALNAPDLTIFRVLSYIPFFTPQLLFLSIGMGTVPAWEIVLILSILIVCAVGINLLAARIYKGGVLMYGKFSFKNGIKQAMRLSKKEE